MDRRDLLLDISRRAGAVLAEHFGKGVHIKKKGELDLVTVADETAERLIVDAIGRHFPDDEIHAEESGRKSGTSGWSWIIDPLDGTTNFAHNFPHFSVSAALSKDGEVVSGVVFDPMKREFFHAHKGEGAWLNDAPISVGVRTALNEALSVTGFSYDRRQRMPELLDRVNILLSNTQGLRRLGSAALDLAYTACGRFDLYIEDGLNPWDVAAGALLVREAGGLTTDFGLNAFDMATGQVVAANKTLFPQVSERLF